MNDTTGRNMSTFRVILLVMPLLIQGTITSEGNKDQDLFGATSKVSKTGQTFYWDSSFIRLWSEPLVKFVKHYICTPLKLRYAILKKQISVHKESSVLTERKLGSQNKIIWLLLRNVVGNTTLTGNRNTVHAKLTDVTEYQNYHFGLKQDKDKRHQSRKLLYIKSRESRDAKPETPAPESEPESSTPVPQSTKSSGSEPEPNAEGSWPEPGPDWLVAFKKWEWAWALHVNGFGAVFTLVAMLPLVEIFRLFVSKRRKTALKVTLLTMIAVFCMTRAIVLFVNPYGSTGRLDAGLTRLLFAIGNPCAISALSLLLLVLIDTTKMNVAPPKFQRLRYIIPVIVAHVILVIASDFIVANYLKAKDLILVCQLYYIIVGVFLTVGFGKVTYKISRNVAANVHKDKKMRKLQIMILVSTVISCALLVVHLYAAVGVFGIYSDEKHVEAWPWWGFQTCQRSLEVAMCLVVIRLNSKTVDNRRSLLNLLPCCHNNQVVALTTNTNDSTFRNSSYATSTVKVYKTAFTSTLRT